MNSSIRFIIIFLPVVIALPGCSDYSRVYDDIKRLKMRPIDMDVSLMMNLSKNYDPDEKSEMTFVEYFDSTECTPCAISRLYLWDLYINKHTEYNDLVKYVFIFSAFDTIDIAFDNYNVNNQLITVYWDSCGTFIKNNPHIPQNTKMHSFLLDRNNTITLIGNPLSNNKIEKLLNKMVIKSLKSSNIMNAKK